MNKRSQKQNIELGAGLDPQFKPAGNSAQKTEQATKPDRTISIPLKHGGGFSAAAQLDPRGALGAPQARARSRVKYLSFHYTY